MTSGRVSTRLYSLRIIVANIIKFNSIVKACKHLARRRSIHRPIWSPFALKVIHRRSLTHSEKRKISYWNPIVQSFSYQTSIHQTRRFKYSLTLAEYDQCTLPAKPSCLLQREEVISIQNLRVQIRYLCIYLVINAFKHDIIQTIAHIHRRKTHAVLNVYIYI